MISMHKPAMRELALELAVEVSSRVAAIESADKIIARAQAFAEFLIGPNPAPVDETQQEGEV